MKKIIILLAGIFTLNFSSAQPFDNIELSNKTYVDGIASIKLCVDGYDFGYPIIKLNSSDKLRLVFDDLEENSRYLKYTLIHCTHDWKLSSLNQLEYLDGFMEDEITDNSYSFNTLKHYVKYQLVFPNDVLRITKSGNYILFVYDDTQDHPVLTRRLMVEEPISVGIKGSVHAASDVNYMFTKQEVDFTVYTGNYIIKNPAQYLNATIMQNERWDNAVMGLKYRSGKPGEYSFDYDNNVNTFNGSSEFRNFSIKSLRYNSDRIVSINFDNRVNNAYVVEDIARPYGAYETNTTLKGRCFYANEDFPGVNTEDYVLTHFTLKCDFPVTDGKLYVFGELTDWQAKKEAELKYNAANHYWEADFFLKQGYYNYKYVYVKDGTSIIDDTYIEGNHWQTQNEYVILVYLQD
ncbi:MAG: DUF5103 domain-containing protein, partial [Bacteroidales bacterium]